MKIMVSCRSEVKGQEFSAWFSPVEQDWSVWSEQPHWAACKGSGLSPLAAGRDPAPVARSALHAGMLIVVGKKTHLKDGAAFIPMKSCSVAHEALKMCLF